jgi:hypothetical protein
MEITSKIDFPTMKKFLLEIEQSTKDIDYSDVMLWSKQLERVWEEAHWTIVCNDPYRKEPSGKWSEMTGLKDRFRTAYVPFRKGLRNFEGGYKAFKVWYKSLVEGKNENKRFKSVEIAMAYPTSICILMEQKKILFDSKLFTDFYKSLYIYRGQLKQEVALGLSDERLYRLSRILLNSLFGLIYGDKLTFYRNRNTTDEYITLLDPWSKLTWSAKDMLEYANVDCWVVIEEEIDSSKKRDQIEWLVNAHGFKIA